MELINKAKSAVKDAKLYWNVPPKGRYMPYKSIAAVGIGGIGAKIIANCVSGMILAVGNTLIGNIIGIPPATVYILYVIAILSSFPLTALRANIIDNTKSAKGKYRPYLLRMGIPTIVLAIAFVWMPYEIMPMVVKCIVVLLFNIAFQFFFTFFNDVYDNYINVLSPNTQERTDAYTVRSVIDSLAPSLINALMPLLARMITGKNTLIDIRIYRYVYPPLLILGAVFVIIIYANTEEKIIQAKTHVIQIKFMDALRAVAKNKYFWIISLAGWIGFLEGASGTTLFWLYTYQDSCPAGVYSLIVAIISNSGLWGMLIAPFAIRKFGKRAVLIFTNACNVLFLALLYPSIAGIDDPKITIWFVACCLWFNGIMAAFSRVLTPSINGDIRDYQQYVTGERIDGMFAAVGLIGSVFVLITSGILPALYSQGGINETVLAELTPKLVASGKIVADAAPNVYNVLYDNGIFEHTIGILIGASVVGATLNVIPYFFYDLTEIKQRGMVSVLKIRAMFEDYGNDVLSDTRIVETIDIINDAEEHNDKSKKVISNDGIKAAKKTKDKAMIKAAKKAYRDDIEFNKKIDIAKFVMDELNRFDSDDGMAVLDSAKETLANGLENLVNINKDVIQKAKALPKSNEREKMFRKTEITSAVDSVRAKKTIKKYYPDGLVEYDMSILDGLFEREDKNLEMMNNNLKKIMEADKIKDKATASAARSDMKLLRKEKAEIKSQIKVAADERAIYYRAAKPYMRAKNLIIQAENYKNYEKIAQQYNEAESRIAAKEVADAENAKRLKEEQMAFANTLKAEKKAKKEQKKK